jgi:hypothetical protein
MDININVRLQKYAGTATSASKSVSDKQSKTSPAKKSQAVKTLTGKEKLAKMSSDVIMKGFLPAAKVAFTTIATAKTLSTLNRVEGAVSGNRFRERRRAQILRSFTNPLGMMKSMVGQNFDQYFDVLRQMEALSYQRDLAGVVLPFRPGNSGITL